MDYTDERPLRRQRRPGGRGRFNRARRDSFLALLRQGVRPYAAARQVNIHFSVVYAHRQKDPVFAAEWEWALEEALEQIEDAAHQMAMAGNTRMIEFVLTNRAPSRWKREPVATWSVKADTNIQVNAAEMDLAELRAATLRMLDEAEQENLELTSRSSSIIDADSVEITRSGDR